MSGRSHVLDAFASEDISSPDRTLGVSVFTGLGRGDFDELAGLAFEESTAAFAKGRGLDRVGEGSLSICGGLGGVFFFLGEGRHLDYRRFCGLGPCV